MFEVTNMECKTTGSSGKTQKKEWPRDAEPSGSRPNFKYTREVGSSELGSMRALNVASLPKTSSLNRTSIVVSASMKMTIGAFGAAGRAGF
jgi:hypothetical protein